MSRAGGAVQISTHVSEKKGQERAKARFELDDGRYVPPEAITHSYELCPSTLLQLRGLVDYLQMVDNERDNQPAREILRIEDGQTTVVDEALYSGYLNEVGEQYRLNTPP